MKLAPQDDIHLNGQRIPGIRSMKPIFVTWQYVSRKIKIVRRHMRDVRECAIPTLTDRNWSVTVFNLFILPFDSRFYRLSIMGQFQNFHCLRSVFA